MIAVYRWDVPTSSYQLQTVSRFVYDAWNVVAELDGASALTRSYVWGFDLSGTLQGAGGVGGLLVVRDGGGETYYPGYDGNGNVVSLVKTSDGTIAGNYEYDPFGRVLQSFGSYARQNPFKFSTKYVDEESGLTYYGFRYYSPELGRWISRDPLEEDGGINLYRMIDNDAVNSTDFLGLEEATFNIVVKSYIARVGTNTGKFPGFGPNKNRRNAVLSGFAALVDKSFSEDPQTDAKDKKYRMYSARTIKGCCEGDQVVSHSETTITTDAGKEGCIQAPDLIIEGEKVEKLNNTIVYRWTTKGTPHLIVEPVFQAIFPRDTREISHSVIVILWCVKRNSQPRVEVMLSRESTTFPSHRVYVNGQMRKEEDLPQGPLVNLWKL